MSCFRLLSLLVAASLYLNGYMSGRCVLGSSYSWNSVAIKIDEFQNERVGDIPKKKFFQAVNISFVICGRKLLSREA